MKTKQTEGGRGKEKNEKKNNVKKDPLSVFILSGYSVRPDHRRDAESAVRRAGVRSCADDGRCRSFENGIA